MSHLRRCAATGIIVLIASLHSVSSLARTWYIRADGSGDAPTIGAGLDSAVAGDDVLVAAGSYTWASEGMATDISGPTMLEVRSGIRLHSESGASVTVLDAERQGRVLACRSCAGIEGFTITGGRTLRDTYGGSYAGIGGGIFVLGGGPLIADNIVRSNYAEGTGGGIGTHGVRTPGTTPLIRGNTVLWNIAGFRTGGIELTSSSAATLVENNTVVGNFGGGITCMGCDGTIARNIVAENVSSGTGMVSGFAMFCFYFEGESPTVECNILWDNSGGDAVCGTDGGGNLSDNPDFCVSDPSGTGLRFVRPDSPALPQNNACGVLIGASGEGCSVTDTRGSEPPATALRVFPNPPTTRASITYSLAPDVRTARLTVYDLRGRVVARILEAGRSMAPHGSMTWDTRDSHGESVAAGVYIVRLETDRGTTARKLVLVR